MKKLRKILKWICKVLKWILVIIIVFLLVSLVINKVKSHKEYNYLLKNGYINKLYTGQYNLNMYRYGDIKSKHKVIGISGRDVNNFGIEMKYSISDIADSQFIFVDRAGYGYSDDTNIKQTVKQIVNDYRNALINTNIEPPYTLMAHSIGGVYATYWESMYPDEIEGVILIDSTEIGNNVWLDGDYSVSPFGALMVGLNKLGFQRYILHNSYYILPGNYSKEDNIVTDYFNIHSFTTNAMSSEIKETNNNTNETYKRIVKNDIPKIYISSSSGFTTVEELKEYNIWLSNRQKEIGIKPCDISSEEKLKELLPDYIKWRDNKIKPYLSKLGNTELILLPGDHMIFEEKPEELKQIIETFLNNL